jgi:hypothetical protein
LSYVLAGLLASALLILSVSDTLVAAGRLLP